VSRQNVIFALVFSPGQLVPPEVDFLEGVRLARVEVGFATLKERNVADARFDENRFA